VKALALVTLVALAACVSPAQVVCGDGRVCPGGTTCDDVRGLCLSEAQTTACDGVADGQPCSATGVPGICDRGFCEPGCGDGVTDPDEQCDDGNFASHDGCSSACAVETPTWIELAPQWQGITQHAAAFHPALGRTIVVGGIGKDGVSARSGRHGPGPWRTPGRGWNEVTDAFPPSARPPARYGHYMAYDPVRQKVVLFGGFAGYGGAADVGLTDTWEYSVSGSTFEGDVIGSWTHVTTAVAPPPLSFSAMAFDGNLGKIVLVGGLDTLMGTLTADMWTYDGTWQKITVTPGPPPRFRHALAFDSARGRLVLFGGSTTDARVYEFDGTGWTNTVLATSPAARRNAVMAFDPVRGKTVLFGGTIAGSTAGASDTWEYDGTWTVVSAPLQPPGRRAAAMVAEVAGSVLLIGGVNLDDGAPFADVWINAAGWRDATPRFQPPGVRAAASTYWRAEHGMIVNGGATAAGFTDETWMFDGARWKRLPGFPVKRYGQTRIARSTGDGVFAFSGWCITDCTGDDGVAHDAYALEAGGSAWLHVPGMWADARAEAGVVWAGDRAIAFAGGDGFRLYTSTWSFDGTTLVKINDDGPKTYGPATAWDPRGERVIAFDASGTTWALDGTTWSTLVAAGPDAPPGRNASAMVYDPFRRRMVMMGGYDASGSTLADIWELDVETATWTQLFVAGASPLPLFDAEVAMHEDARAIVLVGGSPGNSLAQGSTWLFKYVSNTPDETCGDGTDNDGDAQLDDADPDCKGVQ